MRVDFCNCRWWRSSKRPPSGSFSSTIRVSFQNYFFRQDVDSLRVRAHGTHKNTEKREVSSKGRKSMHTRSKTTTSKRKTRPSSRQTQRRRQEAFHCLFHTPTKDTSTVRASTAPLFAANSVWEKHRPASPSAQQEYAQHFVAKIRLAWDLGHFRTCSPACETSTEETS